MRIATAVLCLWMAGCCCGAPRTSKGSVGTSGSGAVPTGAAGSAVRPSAPPSFEMVERYTKGIGGDWGNVIVSPSITRDQLVALARHLWVTHQESRFHIFTDKAGFKRYAEYDKAYATPQAAAHPFPKAWAERHHIANVTCMIEGGRCRWQLVKAYGDERFGPNEKIIDLE